MKKRKPPKWVKNYYKLLEKAKKESLQGLFLPKIKRYKPIVAANNGLIAGLNYAQEELEKIFDIESFEN